MQVRSTFIFLLLFLFLYRAEGQPAVYRNFENISLGSDATVISCFLQDSEGLIWIGSDRGLYSYDGYSTQQHFVLDNPENTRIYCGVVVDNTYLFLGSDNGIHIYNYRTDRYEKSSVSFPTDVRSMILRNDILWIGSLNGLFTYNLKTGEQTGYTPENNPGLTHHAIYSLIQTTDDHIYIGTYNGFCSYDPKEESFSKIDLPIVADRNNQFINSLLEDIVHSCIWIGTEGNLFQYFPADGRIRTVNSIPDNSIKTLALDKSGQLLAGTDNGLYVYAENEPLQYIAHDSRNIRSLSNNIVWSIFTDREHNIWIGTDYGISFFRFNSDFRYVPIEQITGTGEGNHFYSIYKDSKGNFWLGGTNGLIRTGNPDDAGNQSTWYKMGKKDQGLPHNRIRHIFEDSQKQLWVATDGSINRYDARKDRFIRYNIIDSTGVLNSNWSYNILEDEQGRLWIATCLGGLFVVDRDKLTAAGNTNYVADHTFSTRNGLSGMFASQLITGRNGDIWVLLYNNGIDKVNPHTYEVAHIEFHDIIGDRKITYMVSDHEGNIWLGYRGGLLRVDPSGNNFQSITTNKPDNSEILSLAIIENYVWITTTEGVWVVNKESTLSKRLNLMDRSFSSIYYDKDDNKIYMGTVDGIAIVSPDVTEAKTTDRPVLITGLRVNNEYLSSSANDDLHTESIRYIDAINLRYNQNNISLEVSDLPYTQEEKNKFVYKLDGLDTDWRTLPAGNNSIVYNNLAHGKYRLLVSRLDENDSPMRTTQTSMTLNIHPPWHLTTWAKIIYLLLFTSLVAWIINFFHVRNKLRIEHLEKERIMEQSKSKIDFFTNISHDLKTPLSMIIAPISNLLLEVRNSQQKHTLEVVQRNAMKLNSLIHQVLDLNRMDSNASSDLILSRVEFISFVGRILPAYEEAATREKNIRFSFNANREKLYMDIDLIKFESVISNLLSNAFKYTPEGGSIELSLEHNERDNQLDISVKDTGTGIPEKDIPHIFQRFFQSPSTSGKKEGTGIGLYLVKTYTELHGGSIRVQSEKDKGTNITITLPVPTEEILSDLRNDSFPESANAGKPHILIVEDNPEIAEFICHILKADYRISIAENGKCGVELAMELLPDLIIADLMMPVMNGLEMCRQLKRHIPTSTIPIIMLTAKSDKDTELESIHLNIDAFIPKPFQPTILLSRIEQLLSSKKQMEAKARIESIAAPKAIEAVSQDEKLLSEIIGIIEGRVSDPDLNVNALSEISGINTKQLYRKIKQLTGMTPVEYIKSIRMKKAAMLLGQKTFSIAEVIYMVGFSNHSYFAKCFQKEFGKTPKQFMEEN